MKLYDIDERYRELAEKVTEQDGELLDGDWEALDENQISFEQKADNYAGLIKEIEAEIECLKEASARQLERVKKKQNAIDYLKNRLSQSMRLRGKDKLETLNAVIGFRKSQAVRISDESKLPKEFIKTEEKADVAAIRAALLSGNTIDGAELVENKNIQVK